MAGACNRLAPPTRDTREPPHKKHKRAHPPHTPEGPHRLQLAGHRRSEALLPAHRGGHQLEQRGGPLVGPVGGLAPHAVSFGTPPPQVGGGVPGVMAGFDERQVGGGDIHLRTRGGGQGKTLGHTWASPPPSGGGTGPSAGPGLGQAGLKSDNCPPK